MLKRHDLAVASLVATGSDITQGMKIAVQTLSGWKYLSWSAGVAGAQAGHFALAAHVAAQLDGNWEDNPGSRTFKFIPEGSYGSIKFPQHFVGDARGELNPFLGCHYSETITYNADLNAYHFWRMIRGAGEGTATGCTGKFSPGGMGYRGGSSAESEISWSLNNNTHEIWKMVYSPYLGAGFKAVKLARFAPLPNTAAGKLQAMGAMTPTRYAVSLREVDTLGLIKSSSGSIEGGTELGNRQAT